jgi:hypothetical protein
MLVDRNTHDSPPFRFLTLSLTEKTEVSRRRRVLSRAFGNLMLEAGGVISAIEGHDYALTTGKCGGRE